MTRSRVSLARSSPGASTPKSREDEEEEQQREDPEKGEEAEAVAAVAPSSIDHYGRCPVFTACGGGRDSSGFVAILIGNINRSSDQHRGEGDGQYS